MIAANMNTTPTLVFNYGNQKLKIRKKVKIMCENYCLDLDSMPKVLQTLDGVTLSERWTCRRSSMLSRICFRRGLRC